MLALGGGVEVTTACDVLPDRAENLAVEHGLRTATLSQILADPVIDVVIACTPSGSHADIGVPALLAGKHVIVEKPMDVTVAACNRLLAAQRASGAILAVVSQRRFDDAAQRASELVDSDALGSLVHVDCRIPWYRTQEYFDAGDWRGTWDLDGGGCLMNQGLHTVDLLRWLCGPVERVYATMRTAAHERIDVEDVVCATLTFASGAIGTLLASTCSYPAFPSRLSIQGTCGGVTIEGDSLAALATLDGLSAEPEPPMHHAVMVATGGTKAASALAAGSTSPHRKTGAVDGWTEGHRRQLADFVQAVRDGRQPAVDGAEGRNAVQLIEAVYRSARTSKAVTV